METVFRFRDGAHVSGDPQKVGARLTELRQKMGRLRAEDVVEDAIRTTSVLHRYFEWDNAEAAAQYRLEQARHLIAAVVIVRRDTVDLRPIRAFAAVHKDGGYESIEVVMASPDLRKQALIEVKQGIKTYREKLEAFEEFSDVIASLDQVDAALSPHLGQETEKAGVRG